MQEDIVLIIPKESREDPLYGDFLHDGGFCSYNKSF